MKRLFFLFILFVIQLTGLSQMINISELGDKQWKAAEIFDKDISDYESIEEEAYMYFDTYGNLSGSTSCNKFNGKYKLEGNNITLDVITMTKIMCYGSAEMDFLKALKQTANFTFEGQYLYLLNDNKVVMKLIK